jgi:type IV pilus assembly protein PilW
MVELMVALVLGLVLVGGVINVFVTSGQTARMNQNLSRIHENARFTVELMAREIREAGQVPCGSTLSANVIRDSSGGAPVVPWWASTFDGMVRGFDDTQNATGIKAFGTGVAERVTNTDAILILRPSADEADLRRLSAHDATGFSFNDAQTITAAVRDRYYSRPALVCDGRSAALLQIGAASVSLGQYDYSTGTLNCTTNLGAADAACTSTSPRTFTAGSQLTVWDPAFWYVGFNSRGTRSLYRQGIIVKSSTGEIQADVQEMIPDVEDLQIDYLTRNRDTGNVLATDWIPASNAAFATPDGWMATTAEVVAVRARLTLRSTEAVGADGNPLTRTFVVVGSIRNREL